ncbi:MFS transporter [Microbacterium sp. AK031]|uniref:MFS transporter n=1 Tax=Microbacterium sp. AK031 TaxID=2723076 RepID=UPI002169AF18|nr:MFS transporter [Microbacterium sp. AK031]MCS3844615.1 putative MFS family arabinose efflux permease [Microbacterium sp. AK031]
MTMTEPITIRQVGSTAAPNTRTTRARFGFALAVVAQILMMTGASAPSPFYPVLAEQVGFAPIVITAVFAVYAVALLLTLLTAGSLSDHVGRRPVVIVGFVLLAGSMLLFSHADSVALLVTARIIQGIASGLLLSALSAAVLDLAPPARSGTAALWNALSPGIGLATGAVLSGVALDIMGEPLLDVFAPLTATYVILAVLFFFAPETAPKKPGVWASLQFRLSVPTSIRADFWRAAPAVIAGWATGGLFLSLGANIVRGELGGIAHIWQGLGVALLAGVGALTAFVLRRRSPRTITIFGTAALAVGTALSLGVLALESLPAYLVAAGVTGMGFGTAFSGVIASLAPRIPSTDRADTFAVIYVLAYLAFGVPAVVAGMLVGVVGLGAVCVGYGVVVIALSVLALVFRVRRAE